MKSAPAARAPVDTAAPNSTRAGHTPPALPSPDFYARPPVV
ncbi:MAG TPA: hypothetical protein VK388_03900 [Pyrinomonadaceae bacterium]|nr:hypothetical protein [Pyrinomonadaceae bacterium]